MFQHKNYIYPFQNLSLGFILKIFLIFRKFQPRYSYKILYKKKSVPEVNNSDQADLKAKLTQHGDVEPRNVWSVRSRHHCCWGTG